MPLYTYGGEIKVRPCFVFRIFGSAKSSVLVTETESLLLEKAGCCQRANSKPSLHVIPVSFFGGAIVTIDT